MSEVGTLSNMAAWNKVSHIIYEIMAAKNHNDFLERFRGKANHIGVKGLRELLTGPTEKIELLKQDNS